MRGDIWRKNEQNLSNKKMLHSKIAPTLNKYKWYYTMTHYNQIIEKQWLKNKEKPEKCLTHKESHAKR